MSPSQLPQVDHEMGTYTELERWQNGSRGVGVGLHKGNQQRRNATGKARQACLPTLSNPPISHQSHQCKKQSRSYRMHAQINGVAEDNIEAKELHKDDETRDGVNENEQFHEAQCTEIWFHALCEAEYDGQDDDELVETRLDELEVLEYA
jgi:hypothetical protein